MSEKIIEIKIVKGGYDRPDCITLFWREYLRLEKEVEILVPRIEVCDKTGTLATWQRGTSAPRLLAGAAHSRQRRGSCEMQYKI